VLEAPNRDAIVSDIVNKEVRSVGYKRVADWFEYLNEVVHLRCPTQDEVAQLAEVKASRDILVHNKGVVNSTYLDKVGAIARYADGETIEIPEHYHRTSWQLIRQIVADMSAAAIAKAGR